MIAETALLRFTTRNLGDDIQSFAVRQFINSDHTLDRDCLDDGPEFQNLVLFGWLLQSERWPPPAISKVHPLAIHIADGSRELMSRNMEWWKRLETTIPCRDASSAEFFLRHGVSAIFEGCSTLTLKRGEPQQSGTVLFVDAAKTTEFWPRVDFPKVLQRTHKIPGMQRANQEFRRQAVFDALVAYQQAELVVTSRLHVMLPCLAFGTPVLYIKDDLFNRPGNCTRILDYLPHVEVWDGHRSYSTGGRLPINFRPDALTHHVTRRLTDLGKLLNSAPDTSQNAE